MRKIIAGLYMSLDGVVDGTEGWQYPFFDAEWQASIAEGLTQVDTVLLGRRTYLEFAAMWPNMGSEVPMADFMNNAPKYVISSTLGEDQLAWAHSTLLHEVGSELDELTRRPGKDILIPGSPSLVRSLLRAGLLDRLSVNVCPVVAGSGARLFDGLRDQIGLTLVESETLRSGVLSLTYQPTK
jgi:dihydrofolate reductase